MTPPNDIINMLKESRRILQRLLLASGYEYPHAPVTREQAALIGLSYTLDMARTISQLCEEEMYDEVFDIFTKTKTPTPW